MDIVLPQNKPFAMPEKSFPTFPLEKTCRLCLSQGGVLSAIFKEDHEEPGFMSLPSKIVACVNVEVSKEDKLPCQICHRCLYQVEQSYDFKEQCQKFDKILRDWFTQSKVEEEHPDNSSVNDTEADEELDCQEEDDDEDVSEADKALVESLAKCPDLQVVDPPCDTSLKTFCLDTDNRGEPQIQCQLCDITFGNEKLLWGHVAKHNADGPPFSCQVCFQTFGERVSLDEHVKSHGKTFQNESQTQSGLHNCSECDMVFSALSDFRKHALVHAGLRPFKCQICPKEFSRTTNLNKHMRVHSGQRPYSCGECPKMFRTRGDMLRHQIIHTGQKPFSCSVCLLSFNRKDKLTRHERLHSTEKAFSCLLCSMSFNRREDLTKHNLMHMNEESEQITPTDLRVACKQEPEPMDEEETSADGELRLTIVEDTEETPAETTVKLAAESPAEPSAAAISNEPPKTETAPSEVDTSNQVESMVINVDPFQASSCDSSTCWPQNLTVKKTENTPQDSSKPYTCDICNKKFSDKSYMKTHQLTHLGVRPHACSYCGKAFFRRRELLRHEAVHTGVKPFQCKTCQKAFARSDKLMRHERTHGNAQQHPCSHCPAKFVRKDDLTRHEMTHTGQKPHACATCAKTFSTKAELTRHEKTHALKEFKCQLCALVFPKKDKLSAHMRTHDAQQQLHLLDNVVDLRGLMAQCTRFGAGIPAADLHLVPLKQT